MSADIVVVGSVNHDLTVVADRLPAPGETVLGSGHHTGPGGKGANQALAAARLGSRVAMVGRVGRDRQGDEMLTLLAEEGVDVSGVGRDPEVATGLAVITVDGAGENAIVVSPGANLRLGAADVARCEPLIRQARVVLAQLEVPVEAVLAVARLTEGTFCLNPAPVHSLSEELLELVDVLVLNRSELAALTGNGEAAGPDEVREAASRIRGPGVVVVTLGRQGAVVMEGGAAEAIPSPEVEVVDTTGAGDAFCGALGHALCRGDSLLDAARWAVAAGALATTRRGAQAGMPRAPDVEALLRRR